jgi:hypothetical protein
MDNCPEAANADQADGDDDGVVDECDNCPADANMDQADADADGVGDACDEPPPGQGDADLDGVLDADDNCPNAPNVNQADFDTDGSGDVCDNCPNTSNSNQADADEDGVGDACEGDRDDDGVPDDDDNCLTVPNADQEDGDGDGVGDACDNSPTDPNPGQQDSDGDGVGNASDNCPSILNSDQTDSDGDGFGNACDNCPNMANANQADGDGDGIGDACEDDQDSDGVPDDTDNCISVANVSQADTDTDGVGNACDNCPQMANADQADGDSDTVGNVCDNCPSHANADQADTDGDGVGNVCDTTGGTPAPLSVTINGGTSRMAYPCEELAITASSMPSGDTFTWTKTAGGDIDFIANGAMLDVAVPAGAAAQQQFTFTVTGELTGYSAGFASVTITVKALDETPQMVETRSSGAAQPGDTVTLDLDDSEDAEVVWTQDDGDKIEAGTITPVDDQSSTFMAPAVTSTVTLNFNASGCRADMPGVPLQGAVSVPIQVASITSFDLPATVTIGVPLTLSDFLTIGAGAPAQLEVLFFVAGNGDLPPGVQAQITGPNADVLEVSAGAGQSITVDVQIVGTAGVLAEQSDMILIVAP